MQTTEENVSVIQIPELKPFEVLRSELIKLADDYKNIVVTDETIADARKARMVIRDKRYAIQRTEKDNNDKLNDLKKQNKSNAEELIAIIEPVENKIDAGIKAIEDRKAQEKAAKERAEAQRIDAIKKKMYDFDQTVVNGILNSKTSNEINGLLAITIQVPVEETEYAEFTMEMAANKAAAVIRIKQRAEQILKEEAERAEQERIKKELEAKEAELKAEADRQAKAQAEMDAKRKADEEAARIQKEAEEAKLEQERLAIKQEQEKIAEEQQRMAAEKASLLKARTDNRIKELTNLGMDNDNNSLTYDGVIVYHEQIQTAGDDQWKQLMSIVEPVIAKKKAEAAQKAEEGRIAEEARLKAEAELRLQEEADKKEKERIRLEELKPDKEKLLALAEALSKYELPELAAGTHQAVIIKQVKLNLLGTAEYIKEQLNNL